MHARDRTHWRDTLLHFLSRSDEDAAYERLFGQILVRLAAILPSGLFETIWFDIGAGPGTKTKSFLTLLCQHVRAVHLTTIDPDPVWAEYLSRDAFRIHNLSVRYDYISGRVGNRFRSEDLPSQPHLVTAFQVLYDQLLVDDFLSLITENDRTLFIVTAEDPSSALARLRREIQKEARIPCAQSCLPALTASVSLSGRRFELIQIEQQFLRLTGTCIGSPDSPGWFMPFLLGVSVQQFQALSSRARHKCWQIVSTAFANSGGAGCSLPIPDEALIVHPAYTIT